MSGWWGLSLRPSDGVTQIGHLESFIERDARGQWTIDEVSIGMRSAAPPSCPCLAFKLAKGATRGCVMTGEVFVPQRVRTEDSSPVSNTDHKAEAKTADNVGSLHPKSEIAALSRFLSQNIRCACVANGRDPSFHPPAASRQSDDDRLIALDVININHAPLFSCDEVRVRSSMGHNRS